MLLLHIDSQIRRVLDGQDVFYFDESNRDCDDDLTLSFEDFRRSRRKIVLISENFLTLPDKLIDGLFIFIPFKSKFWGLNFSLLLYSVEFLIQDYYRNRAVLQNFSGKFENFTRVKSQIFLKYMNNNILPLLLDMEYTYHWVSESHVGRLMLLNYLMSYLFLSWLEFRETNNYLKCPIDRMLPQSMSSQFNSAYTFLDSFAGTLS